MLAAPFTLAIDFFAVGYQGGRARPRCREHHQRKGGPILEEKKAQKDENVCFAKASHDLPHRDSALGFGR